jgi:hypothetical protein
MASWTVLTVKGTVKPALQHATLTSAVLTYELKPLACDTDCHTSGFWCTTQCHRITRRASSMYSTATHADKAAHNKGGNHRVSCVCTDGRTSA